MHATERLSSVEPTPDERQRRQTDIVNELSALLPPRALLWRREDVAPYECDGLTAYREHPLVVALPETDEQVAAVLRICHGLQAPVVARGAGTGPVGRRAAAPHGRHAEPGQVQSHPEDRPARAHGHRAVRRAQPRDQRGRGAAWAVLRARSEQPDRLHDRRQRGRKLGRRALPEIRAHAAQRAARAGLHGRRRAGRVRQRGARCARARPARARRRQRRHARGDDRGDGEADPEAAARALRDGELRRHPQGRRCGGQHHRARHHPGRPRDDGQADDRRRRGLRARRLRPRRRRRSCCAKATARPKRWKRKSPACSKCSAKAARRAWR